MSEPFPDSLLTPNPAAGHELARRLAARIEPGVDEPADMASGLRAGAIPPSTRSVMIAAYFHAITVANRGWNDPPGP